MGKTIRINERCGDSKHCKADKIRGFMKKKKRNQHHAHRNKNNNKDINEETYVKWSNYDKRVAYNRWVSYDACCDPKYSNVPHRDSTFNDVLNEKHGYNTETGNIEYYIEKWTKTDGDPIDILNRGINDSEIIAKKQNKQPYYDKYVYASKKQLERRGKLERFTGHRN